MLYQRGKVWWFKFNYCGRRIQESTKETNKNRAAEAERRYRNRLGDAYNVVPGRRRRFPFSVAAETLIASKSRSLAPKSLVTERLNLRSGWALPENLGGILGTLDRHVGSPTAPTNRREWKPSWRLRILCMWTRSG